MLTSRKQHHTTKDRGQSVVLGGLDVVLKCVYRLTSLELQTLKIPNVMICDTMVGSLFQNHNIHAVGMCKTYFQH